MGGLAAAGFAVTGFSRVRGDGLAASADGAWLAVGGSDGRVRVFDPATGKRRQAVTVGPPMCAVDGLAWSPDGGRLVASRQNLWDDRPRFVGVADLRSGDLVWERPAGNRTATRGVSWSPAGALVAWADEAGVTVADAGTGEARFVLPIPRGVGAVAFSPDGRQLAAGGLDSRVRVWDVETRKEVFVLAGHQDWVASLAWSPDGGRLASGGSIPRRGGGKGVGSGDVFLWDARTGKAIATMPDSHRSYVTGVAFDGGGNRLASVSQSGTVKVWNGHTGEMLSDLTRVCNDISGTGVAWLADGRLAVAMTQVLVLDPRATGINRRLWLRPE
ncbi:MAG: hypothetical protein JWO38_7862 [Gemmataceae bacterium]|nr:hypothetical protein [Gemmataceae bacterium]